MSAFLVSLTTNPYYVSYIPVSSIVTLANGLSTMATQILNGTLSTSIAALRMQIYAHTYSSLCSYLIQTDFTQDLIDYTAATGGPVSLWDGFP